MVDYLVLGSGTDQTDNLYRTLVNIFLSIVLSFLAQSLLGLAYSFVIVFPQRSNRFGSTYEFHLRESNS